MKFGHLLKTFEADAALPDTVCLNYKKLKKLIKKHQQAAPAPAAVEVPQAADAEAGRGAIPAAPQAAVQQAAATAVAQVADVSEGHAAGEVSSKAVAAVAGVPAAAQGAASADATATVAEEDREFVATLNTDLSRINAHFMEKEEEAVIRLRALEDRLAAASGGMSALEMEQLRNEMVDFHGELVLMLHWSLVNYAAVAKILKKHDKMTGSRLRAPVLASVLHQPFLSTESISQLVKEAERHVQELAQLCGTASSDGTVPSACEGSADVGCGGDDGEAAGSSGSHVAIYKRTRAALHMVKEMQETASTPSTLMPPSAAAAAASDAAPDGKKQRTGQQSRGSQQQQQQQALGPEQDSLSRDAVPSATS